MCPSSALSLSVLLSIPSSLGDVVAAAGTRIVVKDSEGLRAALAKAEPGDTIELEGGTYSGGLYFREISGKKNKPITIRAKDVGNAPRFEGGGRTAMQFSDTIRSTCRTSGSADPAGDQRRAVQALPRRSLRAQPRRLRQGRPDRRERRAGHGSRELHVPGQRVRGSSP